MLGLGLRLGTWAWAGRPLTGHYLGRLTTSDLGRPFLEVDDDDGNKQQQRYKKQARPFSPSHQSMIHGWGGDKERQPKPELAGIHVRWMPYIGGVEIGSGS